jgi:ABC transporter substrate binding protein/NMT1/THI5 like
MKAVILAVSLFLPISFYSVVSAQLTKMTVGYGSTSTNHFPAWMAKESGIFRVNGLDVQLVYFRGGTTAMMALLSRETPISEIAGPSVVGATLRGTDVVLIASGIVTSDQSLVTRPDIKTAERITDLVIKNRVPAIYPNGEYVEDGGLMSYGPNIVDLFRRAATYVDKTLKGAKPGDLPVEQPTKFELVINLKAAKQIGLTIPANLLLRADKVIK